MEVVRDKDSSYCLCGTCQKTVFMQTITTSYCRECGGLIASEHRPAQLVRKSSIGALSAGSRFRRGGWSCGGVDCCWLSLEEVALAH